MIHGKTWLGVGALMFCLAGCGSSYMVPPAEPSLLAQPEDASAVRTAIVLGLADRKFRTESEQGQQVIAHFNRGPNGMRVLVEYDDRHYTVHILQTRGYKTRQEGGQMVIEKRAASALKSLYTAIDRELARPAKERAAAEKAQRDYELQMQATRTAQAQAEAQTAAVNAQQAQQPDQGQEDSAPQGWDATFQAPPPSFQVKAQVQVNTSVSSATCCINGQQYACPNQAAFQACAQMNPSGCTASGTCR